MDLFNYTSRLLPFPVIFAKKNILMYKMKTSSLSAEQAHDVVMRI